MMQMGTKHTFKLNSAESILRIVQIADLKIHHDINVKIADHFAYYFAPLCVIFNVKLPAH
jgi:hypothetical protein